ncbi:MAG: acetate--CoA ligase family protein [Afipia sp.]|nr:acetate--CoA ligase family protein [Afipia sp.]
MSDFGLEKILAPKSIALVGGSARLSSLGSLVLKNIRSEGFGGEIGVVNPKYSEIGGVKTFPSLSAMPFVPDVVVITAPAAAIPGIMGEAGERGVTGAIIISSGLGHGPGSVAEETAKIAYQRKVRIVGPNCLGVMSPAAKLNASFAAKHPASGSLALISQSGAIAAAMVDWGHEKSVGFSAIVSVGDQLDVDIADLLNHFARDDKTSAILLYTEAIFDARKFMSAARAAAQLKPVVVVKSGRMTQGAKAAATHTGALAGSDSVYDAAFRRAGLVRVFDLRELFDCAELLGRGVALPKSNRLSILTNGGGLGVLAVDRLSELGGTLPALDEQLRARLDSVLPPTWSRADPVDIGGDADAQRYVAAVEPLLADPSSDALLIMNVETAVASAAEIAEAIADCVNSHRVKSGGNAKPVLAVWVGTDRTAGPIFDHASIPHFPTEADAVQAFMHLVKRGEAADALMTAPHRKPLVFSKNVSAARSIIAKAIGEGRRWLDPIESIALLTAYAIPVVRTVAVSSPEEAASIADGLITQGFSIVVKILSRDISHKSDVGGVVLGLRTAEAVRRAAFEILERVKQKRPEARIEGLMIQPMIEKRSARELIVGIADDPTFGPVIAFGRGGTAVEIFNDKSLALPPLDMDLARDLVGRSVVSRLLPAYRDVPAVPPDVVPLTLIKLSEMAADCPEIVELDINPLLADETGVIALDARVAVRTPRNLFSDRTRFAVQISPQDRASSELGSIGSGHTCP